MVVGINKRRNMVKLNAGRDVYSKVSEQKANLILY
jgi:hypothetical protein